MCIFLGQIIQIMRRTSIKSHLSQPAWCRELWRPHRYKVLYGGRGGGKSYTVADALLVQGLQQPERILCCREIQGTVRDSVHKLLATRIHALGLDGAYRVLSNEIRGQNGTTFLYRGLRHNAQGLKSTAGLTKVWVEEAQTVTEESWRILIPTVREEQSEIWLTFNPRWRSDATSKRFLLDPPPGAWVQRVTWRENPWFPQTLEAERQEDLAKRPDSYAHIWEGAFEPQGASTLIPFAWIEAAIDLVDDLGVEATGVRLAGLDVAGAGDGGDVNALALRHGVCLAGLESWNGQDTSYTTSYATALATRFGAARGFYDSVGVGAGVTGEWAAMHRRGQVPAGFTWSPWNGGGRVLWPRQSIDPDVPCAPTHGDQFQNLKAQAWVALRNRFYEAAKAREGQGFSPDEVISLAGQLRHLEPLKAELAQVEFTTNAAGRTCINKQGAGGNSPNLADAVVMAFWPTDEATYHLRALA